MTSEREMATVDGHLTPTRTRPRRWRRRRRRPSGPRLRCPTTSGLTGRLWLGVLAVLLGGALVALEGRRRLPQTERVRRSSPPAVREHANRRGSNVWRPV